MAHRVATVVPRGVSAWMAARSIRARVILLAVITVFAIGFLTGGNLWSANFLLQRTADANEQLDQEAVPLVTIAESIGATNILIGELLLLPGARERYLAEINTQTREVDAAIARLEDRDLPKRAAFFFNRGVQDWRLGIRDLESIVASPIPLLDSRSLGVFSRIRNAARNFRAAHEIANQSARAAFTAAEDARDLVLIVTSLIAGLALLVAAGGLYALLVSVIGPIQRLQTAALRLADGQVQDSLCPDGPRELADLASAFNRMTAEVQRRERDLSFNALHDPLTGLGNRALLEERLSIALSYSGRFGGVVSLLLIDLDHFKKVNDSVGHSAGDAVLVTVAQRLAGIIDDASAIVRLGGDEFAIVLDADDTAAAVVAERVRAVLSDPFTVEGRFTSLTASIGVTTSYGGQPAEDLVREADLAMYAAKDAGRNQVCLYTPSLHEAANDRLVLEEDLRDAIEQEALDVHYQPIVNLHSQAITGVEALVRWNHPSYGPLSPDRFIPMAEETGLIDGLGRHVLRVALRDARAWLDQSAPEAFTLAVNVSGHQLQDPTFCDQVFQDLRDSGFPARQLVLEITETVLVEQTDQARDSLERLRRTGIRIALDDFGTGYTSFEYLGNFPIDVIKIDRAFVAELSQELGHANIVRSILQLATGFGAYFVAEGVENEADADALRNLGCQLAQGYAFCRPAPEPKIRSLLQSGDPLCIPVVTQPANVVRAAS